jgi:hypothetical protein
MRVIHVTLGLLIFATSVPAFAQGGHEGMVTGPDNLKWGPAPPELSGAQIAVLYGDPSKEGPFVLRLKLPSNYQIPAHHHSMAESVTVISGDFYAGMGDKLNRNDARLFPGLAGLRGYRQIRITTPGLGTKLSSKCRGRARSTSSLPILRTLEASDYGTGSGLFG